MTYAFKSEVNEIIEERNKIVEFLRRGARQHISDKMISDGHAINLLADMIEIGIHHDPIPKKVQGPYSGT